MKTSEVSKITPEHDFSRPSIVLQPGERDAIASQILANLGQLGDLETMIDSGVEEEECYRLGRQILDALRLILDGGLGWKERTVDPTPVTLPAKDLHQIMFGLQTQARALLEATRPEREAMREKWDEFATLEATCTSALEKTNPV